MTTRQKTLDNLTGTVCRIADLSAHLEMLYDEQGKLTDAIARCRADLRSLFDERENLQKALHSFE